MSNSRRILLSAVAAVALAAALLGASALAGVQLVNNVRTSNEGSPGVLSVLLTDPPNVPAGVTAVKVNYSDLAIHVSEAGNESGWKQLSTGGSIDLLSTVNISQTIAAVNVASGDYNALRLNVTSASVTFDGHDYAAFVIKARLFIPIAGGGIEVNDSKPSATIIDISPLVMNIGSSSTPEFVIRTTAVAFPVPSSQVTEDMEHEGFRFRLGEAGWWARFNLAETSNLRITGVSLSASSLKVSVKDISSNTTVKMVVISPLWSGFAGGEERMTPMIFGTVVFVVERNGSLVQLQHFFSPMMGDTDRPLAAIVEALQNAGYSLAANTTASFSYSGQINLGFSFGSIAPRMIVSGQQYLVTVIGEDALAGQVVVAT